jgi:hypothetical protein
MAEQLAKRRAKPLKKVDRPTVLIIEQRVAKTPAKKKAPSKKTQPVKKKPAKARRAKARHK